MAAETWDSSIAITRVQKNLIVTMQPDLDSRQFHLLSGRLGEQVEKEKTLAVILDFSTVDLLSLTEFERIRSLLLSLNLLGSEVAIASLCTTIVVYLAEADVVASEIHFFLCLDEAIKFFVER
jgi:anti-anti-sigma regulatory factor